MTSPTPGFDSSFDSENVGWSHALVDLLVHAQQLFRDARLQTSQEADHVRLGGNRNTLPMPASIGSRATNRRW
jgi:hypothetical protein